MFVVVVLLSVIIVLFCFGCDWKRAEEGGCLLLFLEIRGFVSNLLYVSLPEKKTRLRAFINIFHFVSVYDP